MTRPLGEFGSGSDRVVLRPFADGDEAGFVDCYNRIFPVDDDSVPSTSLEEWRWKFAPRPSNRLEIVVAEHATEGIIGAYPCQSLEAVWEGNRIRTSQIVDLMVRHEFRRVGERPGLFVALGRAFYDLWCGPGDDQQLFNYGWPVPAWRMGQRYLGYLNIRDWNFLAKEVAVDRAQLPPIPAGLRVEEVTTIDEPAVDALFARVQDTAALGLVKDGAWFRWRYLESPRRYRVAACRDDGGQLRGMVVYGIADFRRPNTAFVIDWLVHPAEHEVVAALLAWCEAQAREDETGAIAGVWNPVDPRFHQLQLLGYRVWDSSYFLVVASFHPRLDTHYLRESWHYTMGESDLV